MTVLTSSLIVKLIDAVSGPAKKAAESLKRIGQAARGLNGTKVSGSLVDGLNKSLDATGRKIDALRSKMLDATAIGYGLGRALAAPLGVAREFESTLLDIAQKGDLSDAAMAKVGRQVGELAGKLKKTISQNELAKGVDILAGFGLDTERAMTLLQPIGRATVAYKSSVEDLSKAGFAAMDNMKVPADQFAKALDVMAQAGKEGAFELKDMAREFPALTAAADALEMRGVKGVAKLSAALQIAKKGAATGSEAATNTANLMQKIVSPETTKKFKKVGIDIRAELKKVQKEGGDVFEMIARLVTKATKGDLSKMGDFFQDSEVQKFLRPLIANLEEYKRIRDKAFNASGVVDADFERRLKTGETQLAVFKNRIEDLGRSLGAALLPGVNALLAALGPVVDTFASLAERFPALTATIVALTAGLIGLRVAAIAAAFAGLQLKAAWLGAALAGARFRAAIAAAALLALAPFKVAAIALIGVLQTIALRFRLAAAAGLAFNRALLVGTLATFTRGLGGVALALLALLGPMRLVRGGLMLLRGALLASGIGAGLVAIGAAATWISNNWEGVGKAFESFKASFLSSIAPIANDPAAKGLVEMGRQIASAWEAITGKVDEGTMKRFGASAGEALGDLTKRVVALRRELLETLSLIPGLGHLKPKDEGTADPRDKARRVGPGFKPDDQDKGFDWGEFFTPAEGGDLIGTWATKLRTWLKSALAGLVADIAVEGAKAGIALVEGITSAGAALTAWASSTTSTIASSFSGLVSSLSSAGAAAIGGLLEGMQSAAGGLTAWISGLADQAGQVASSLSSSLQSGASSVQTWLAGIPGQVSGAFTGLAGTLQAAGSTAMHSLLAGMQAVWSQVVAWASSVAGQIAAAFSNLSGVLNAAGQAAMQGLFDGMKAIGESIVAWASGLAGRIGGVFSGIGGRIRGALGGASAPAGGGGAPAAAPAAPAAPATPAPARARGGHVAAGQVYQVNDDGGRDPVELFRPGRSGTILPSSERRRLAQDQAAPADAAPLSRIADRLASIGAAVRLSAPRQDRDQAAPKDSIGSRLERVVIAMRDRIEGIRSPEAAPAAPAARPALAAPAASAARPAPAAPAASAAPAAAAPAPVVVDAPRPITRAAPAQAPAAAPAAPPAPASRTVEHNGPLIGSVSIVNHGVNDPDVLVRQVMTKLEGELRRAKRSLFSDTGLRTT